MLASAFLGLLAAYYWPFLSGSECFYHRDSSAFFEPFCEYIGAALRHARFPLWNSYLYCGMSQAAVTSPGIFYPPHLLFAIFPYSSGLAFLQIFHQFVAAAGAFVLVQQAKWGTPAAVTAALIVGLCGYQFATIDNYTLTASFAWLPACIASLLQLGRTDELSAAGAKIALVCLAIFTALMILGGRPEVAFEGLVILLLTAVWQLAVNRRFSDGASRTQGARIFGIQIIGLVLGLLLAMPGILPAAEWAALSPRAAGLESTSVLAWSANWYDLLGIIVSQPLGDTTRVTCPFLSLAAERPGFVNYIGSAFVGAIAVTLAVWGMFDATWPWRHRLPVLIVLVVALLASMGGNVLGLGMLISKIQLLRLLRYPIKLIIFVDAALAVLAARGVVAALSNPGDKRQIKAALTLWGLLGAFAVSLYQGNASLSLLSGSQNAALLHRAAGALLAPCIWAVLLGLGTCFARVCLAGGRIKPPLFAGVVIASTALTLSYAAFAHQIRGAGAEFYASKPAMQAILERERMPDPGSTSARLFFVDINSWTPGKAYLDAHGGIDRGFWAYQRDILKPNSNMEFGVSETFGYEASMTRAFQNLVFDAVTEDARSRQAADVRAGSRPGGSPNQQALSQDPRIDQSLYKLCRLTATGIVATRAGDFDDRGAPVGKYLTLSDKYFEPIGEINDMLNVKCYRVRNPLGRAYFPRSWTWKQSAEEIERACIGAGGHNGDPLERSFIYSPAGNCRTGAIVASDTEVPVVEFLDASDEEHVTLHVKAKASRLLVLADTYYPGWKALVDRNRADMFCVNVFSRGLFVPAGSHIIEFVYDPPSVKVALVLSALAFAAVGCLMILAGCQHKFFRNS